MMLSRLTGSKFIRDALSLSGGTAIAQIIAISTIPLLTRLYSPEEFGILALYTAFASLFSFFASLKLEQIIMLPEEEQAAAAILVAIFFSSVLFALVIYGVAFLYGDYLLKLMGKPELVSLIYLFPVSIFLMGFYQGLRFWQMRRSNFKLVSVGFISAALTNIVVAILIGVLGGNIFGTSGLLVGYVMQGLVNAIFLLVGTHKEQFFHEGMSRKHIADSIKPYKTLIQTLVVSQGISAIHSKLPSIAISSIFGNVILGYYSMAERVVTAPSQLVANGIGDVYRQRASIEWREKRNFENIFRKTLLLTSLFAVPIYIIGICLIQDIFIFLLGEKWATAGLYAQIIMAAGMVRFITTPLDKGAVIVGAKKFIFLWNMMRLIGVIAVITIVFMNQLQISQMIWLLVIVNIIAYLVNLCFEYKYSSNTTVKKP